MKSHKKGLPVLIGFLSSLCLIAICIHGFFHKGILWPKKTGDEHLTWPQAGFIVAGSLLMFSSGAYFLFVLKPGADAKLKPLFFRALLWIGFFAVLVGGKLPDSAFGGGVAMLDNIKQFSR